LPFVSTMINLRTNLLTSAMFVIRHNAQLYVSSQYTVICFATMRGDMFRHDAQ